MTLEERISLIIALSAFLGVLVTVIGVPSWMDRRERKHQRERAAKRKLDEADRCIRKAEDAHRELWSTRQSQPLDERQPGELEEEAESHLLDGLAIGPSRRDRAKIHLRLGRLAHHRRHNPIKAEKELLIAIKCNRRSWEAFEELGLVKWVRGDLKSAVKHIKRARKLVSRNIQALERLDGQVCELEDQITIQSKKLAEPAQFAVDLHDWREQNEYQ